jgi:xanthine dehydrogenase accessory factor
VGGHCAQPTVVRQSLAAMEDGQPRLVVLSPDAVVDVPRKAGVIPVAMTCAGQGELQIFVEPFLPKAELVVIGATPVARTLARLASLLDFEVWACDPNADMEAFPEADRLMENLEALKSQLSPRSYVVIATFGGYDEAAIEAVHQPAEIAFSVMAALLELRRERVGLAPEEAPAPRAEAIDPICGMTVDIATAMHKTERHGQMYYFCCAGCQAKFEAS